jgi:hypothetical protein
MLDEIIFNALLFLMVSEIGEYEHIEKYVLAFIFALVQYLLRFRPIEGFNYMPDSHKTTCAKGSVPAGNGLDCKLPSDRYGL